MFDPRLTRAELLMAHKKYELAEQVLRSVLADDPTDSLAHALLSQSLRHRNQLAEATTTAEQAVGFGPDNPVAYYALALARYARNHYPEAEAAAREAIRLVPTDPDFHAVLASIHLEREQFSAALESAERGLEQDPDHVFCGNLRAKALTQLGRKDEAAAAAAEALARAPDDAFTHATRGWGLLHERKPTEALVHFREAVRLDPEFAYAKAGLVEALKARYWVYRQVLGYFLWMSRLSPQTRWGIVVGLLVLQRILAATVKANPDLEPVLLPLLVGYFLFAMTTWTAVPLADLFLRLNRFGRYALDPDRSRASWWVAGCLGSAAAAAGWALVGPEPYQFLGWPPAIAFLLLILPVFARFQCAAGWPRRVMTVYALGMAGLVTVGVWSFVDAVLLDTAGQGRAAVRALRQGTDCFDWNLWAALASGFLANWLIGKRVRR